MKPLFVLLGTFLVGIVVIRLSRHVWDYRMAGRIAMGIMLLFTSIAHFAFTRGMEMMMPSFIPFKKAFVYLTGLAEIALAIGLLFGGWQVQAMAGLVIVLLFMLMLPANVYAARKHVDHEKGTLNGKGPGYLWFRIPLQAFFIAWVYFMVLWS